MVYIHIISHIKWLRCYAGLFGQFSLLFLGFLFVLFIPPNSGLPSYEALLGDVAEIPCNFTILSDDGIALVLWYRGNSSTPIYTLDARNGLNNHPKHFPSDILGDRAYFDVDEIPSVLRIQDIRQEDSGQYRCRVDYKHDRTENICFWLDVIVPPRETIIMDEFGQHLRGLIGPYNEGSSLLLICEADGGRPPPALTWKKGGKLLSSNFTLTPQGFSRNEVVLPELRREDLFSSLTCEASNNDIRSPVTSSVTVDLNLRPLDVKITTSNRPVHAGQQVEFVCETWGARPPSEITWWKGIERLTLVSDVIAPASNLTVSTVVFTPEVKDNEKNITCRADNKVLKNSVISDVRKLIVYYTPRVKITPRYPTNLSNVQEGSEVLLDCIVQSNPQELSVWWLFKGLPMHSNPKFGILITNYSLSIQNVQKRHKGKFQCIAVNKEGEESSREVFLQVIYPPVCKAQEIKTYAALVGSKVRVTCEVEAQPPEVNFRWSINNSFGELSINTFIRNQTSSVAVFSPKSEMEYGTLFCWAKNKVGEQKRPCMFNVIPGAPPEVPKDCLLINQTRMMFVVRCSPPIDQGLSQHFQLEVYNKRNDHLQENISASDVPLFVVHSLPPGTPFVLFIYSVNAKGRSPPVTLHVRTLDIHPESNKKGESTEGLKFAHVLGIIVGMFLVLLIMFVLNFVLRKLHRTQLSRRDGRPESNRIDKLQTSFVVEEESPKHDVQLLDLISTKRDFSGPPDVTHTSVKWNHMTPADGAVEYTKDQLIPVSPTEKDPWQDRESKVNRRSDRDDESPLCIISESANALYDTVKWRAKPFHAQSLIKPEDVEKCVTSETPLMNTIIVGEQSLQIQNIVSTEV
ncbi:hemicentin-2-like [Limulus polyphemus]|uniref:Hemicentin-2-like n=1 Tax=Limulus polyphemus TaxID=6850 RepID=A0ABM1S444_LIMPO|nr:hemicentin-2-like [Limulus polyphemus]